MSTWFTVKRYKPILVWKDSPLQTTPMHILNKSITVEISINHAFKKCIMNKTMARMTTEERSFMGKAETSKGKNCTFEASYFAFVPTGATASRMQSFPENTRLASRVIYFARFRFACVNDGSSELRICSNISSVSMWETSLREVNAVIARSRKWSESRAQTWIRKSIGPAT